MSENAEKKRKTWRNPDGSVYPVKEKSRSATGAMKTETAWYARKRYADPVTGKLKEKKRRCKTQTEAISQLAKIKAEIDDELQQIENPQIKPAPTVTFFQLIDLYEKEYVKPALFSGNQKVSGFREPIDKITKALDTFKEFFGDVVLAKIHYSDLKSFKDFLLNKPVITERRTQVPLTASERQALPPMARQRFRHEKHQVSTVRNISTVNRLLGRLRRILNVAVQRDLLQVNPFKRGDSLISQALENERLRLLTTDEEKRILSYCVEQREHLRAVIICALDTALRRGEILSLCWRDVDLEKRVIRVKALNTKTLRPRIVPVSSRLKTELENIKAYSFNPENSERIFPFDSIKNSFSRVREFAAIDDIHFHDLRGTAITRMLQAGMSAPEVMKISGHSTFRVFSRYVKFDVETAQRIGTALDEWLERAAPQAAPSSAQEKKKF